MKTRYALMLAAALALPTAVWADDADPVDNGQALQNLQLNPTQQQQVKTIQEQARIKHQAIRKETHASINKILTPEQRAKFESNMKTRAERREDRREDKMEARQEKRAEKLEAREEKRDAKTEKRIDKLEGKIDKVQDKQAK